MSIDNGDLPSGSVAVVIPAAGRGERLGGVLPKALEHIGGEALLTHVLRQVSQVPDIRFVVVAAPADYFDQVKQLCAAWPDLAVTVIGGGKTRQESVGLALQLVPKEAKIVLVHDAARALTPAQLFIDVVEAVRSGADAVVPGLPVTDTIKTVDAAGFTTLTVSRSELRAIQTPQGFRRRLLLRAHKRSNRHPEATDEAGLVERLMQPVLIIPGHAEAFKITTPFDIWVAEAVLRSKGES